MRDDGSITTDRPAPSVPPARTGPERVGVGVFRPLAEVVGDGVVIHQDGSVVYLNPAAARMIGRPVAELIGAALHELVDLKTVTELLAGGPVVTAAAVTSTIELGLRHADGRVVPVESVLTETSWQDRP